MFEKILIAVDFSPISLRAVQLGSELAGREGASVTLLHVHDPASFVPATEYERQLLAQPEGLRAKLDAALAGVQRRAEAAGAALLHTQIAEGVPAAEIVRCAAEGSFDLIVIGTHGRRGLQHLLLGSVAERVLRTAACPVLSVRAPSPER